MARKRKRRIMARKKRKRRSPLRKAYDDLRSKKASHCRGNISKTKLTKQKKKYIRLARKSGQTKREATKKANRVVKRSCPK